MREIPFISSEEVEDRLSWSGVLNALEVAHRQPKADIDDVLFKHGDNAVLSRAAWIQGTGIAIKTATIFPGNANADTGLPTVQSIVTLFDDLTGSPVAILDGTLVTKWKTAGDSLLGSKLLARPNSKRLAILGAGSVASSLIDAYREVFPDLQHIAVWNHHFPKAQRLAKEKNITAVEDLEDIVRSSDIISSATTAIEPFIQGEWIKPGTHIDLIGAFRPDMREAQDSVLVNGRIFVDSFETALYDIGELGIPLRQGTILESDVLGDFYDLCQAQVGRITDDEVTIFKNGGGAHLDLAVTAYIRGRL
tara:strand:- start:1197 stop:2117 length:921 start_codon:yes stop_codon:yes gene_type:complete